MSAATSWSPTFGMNPPLPIKRRERLVHAIEDESANMISNHISAPGFGQIVRVDGKRYWRGI